MNRETRGAHPRLDSRRNTACQRSWVVAAQFVITRPIDCKADDQALDHSDCQIACIIGLTEIAIRPKPPLKGPKTREIGVHPVMEVPQYMQWRDVRDIPKTVPERRACPAPDFQQITRLNTYMRNRQKCLLHRHCLCSLARRNMLAVVQPKRPTGAVNRLSERRSNWLEKQGRLSHLRL